MSDIGLNLSFLNGLGSEVMYLDGPFISPSYAVEVAVSLSVSCLFILGKDLCQNIGLKVPPLSASSVALRLSTRIASSLSLPIFGIAPFNLASVLKTTFCIPFPICTLKLVVVPVIAIRAKSS